VSPSGRASLPFYFFDRYDRETVAQTWQVLRSEFDSNAAGKHARKRHHGAGGTTVKELIWEGGPRCRRPGANKRMAK